MGHSDGRSGRKVVAYIDGFNVYYGLKAKGWVDAKWLDYRALMESFLLPDQHLEAVRYFTAHIPGPEDALRRQVNYLKALEARGGVDIVLGRMERRPFRCTACGHNWKKPQEKESDVNLAVALLSDAYEGRVDEAWIICADSDLIPAVRHVTARHDTKVVALPPPGRRSDALMSVATGSFHVSRREWRRCQLPETVDGAFGSYSRPPEWLTPERPA